MPRFKQIAKMLQLMENRDNIRNIGIVAHIDHGKTTLTDSLLAGSGLLPLQIAGKARALDYLEEEQKRGITIKTASISLLYTIDGQSFVVNLFDTPGHVDFAGKVARALRAIDGVIVVVDAVEEILAQTETVTRQALNERVKPVLFINKVDRLIEELKLTSEQIQDKFVRIVRDFNSIIESYGEEPFGRRWKVSLAQESVVFGSALHRWGMTTHVAREKGMPFSHIMQTYKDNDRRKLSQFLPLHSAIFRVTLKNIPSPIDAQAYRLPKIWKGDIGVGIGKAMLTCDSHGPIAICLTNAQFDPETGIVFTGRTLSGKVAPNEKVYLVDAQQECEIRGVYINMGASREVADRIGAGNIVALTGLDAAKAGETVVDISQKENMVPFEPGGRISEPVMTVVVEPSEPSDLARLTAAMDRLVVEDPDLNVTLSRETGEYLLSGMGELHLQIAAKSLQELMGGAGMVVSEPQVAYRETITDKGKVSMSKTADRKNVFWIQCEPLSKEKSKLTLQDRSLHGTDGLLITNKHGNVLVNTTKGTAFSVGIKDAIVSGYDWACEAGPLCSQPITGIQANLINAKIAPSDAETAQVSRAIGRGIFGSFLTAKPVLFEPVYRFELTTPNEMLGQCSKIIARRRGKITSSEPRGFAHVVSGFLPVAETYALAAQLRSATSGRAFWQLTFHCWKSMSKEREAELVTRIRKQKGLAPEIPNADTFAEMIS